MIDVNISTQTELEQELNRLYELFEKTKNECYDKYVEMSKIQQEYDIVDKEIKKRNGIRQQQ